MIWFLLPEFVVLYGKPNTQATLVEHAEAGYLIYVGRRPEVA
jgi:hypothetical protein